MSYFLQLKMRCRILRATDVQFDGLISTDYEELQANVRCFLDLQFIRPGKDPMWTPENGDVQNRAGVLFLTKDALVMPGDRIEMTVGPTGTFLVDSSIDEIWTTSKKHHLECHVTEINRVYVPGV